MQIALSVLNLQAISKRPLIQYKSEAITYTPMDQRTI